MQQSKELRILHLVLDFYLGNLAPYYSHFVIHLEITFNDLVSYQTLAIGDKIPN